MAGHRSRKWPAQVRCGSIASHAIRASDWLSPLYGGGQSARRVRRLSDAAVVATPSAFRRLTGLITCILRRCTVTRWPSSCLGRAGLKRNRVLFAYSAPEKMSGPFGCSSGSSITNAGARRWMTSRRRRGSANGGRLANGRHAQAVPQKAADGLDELGHRARLRQIASIAALADPLLVEPAPGARVHRDRPPLFGGRPEH